MAFESSLRQKEEAFIQFKKDFGHPYNSQTYYLLQFDKFCLEEYPDATTLTEEMAMRWSVIKPSESSNGYVSRISTLRQFGKYLAMTGDDAFILPDGLKGCDMPLLPYVFTQKSLNSFFSYTDTMEWHCQSTAIHLVAPVIFRYMYCCGLRPIEARRLNRDDVNLKTGRVFIQESKHHRERIVYVPDNLLELTKAYLQNINTLFPNSTALFVDRKGRHLSAYTHQYLFKICRDGSGIKAFGTRQPNMYSFRHSFATHRIYQWHKEGKDINSLLPVLSVYMGHSQYQNTLYYLHFLPELFSDMAGFDFEQFSEIIPEVREDD
jgi:integrase